MEKIAGTISVKALSPRGRNVLRTLRREATESGIVPSATIMAQDGRTIRALRNAGVLGRVGRGYKIQQGV